MAVVRLPSAPSQYGTNWANQYTRTIENEFQNIWNQIQLIQQSVLPNYTTAEKVALGTVAAGTIIFDTTLAKACIYTGAGWETITSVP